MTKRYYEVTGLTKMFTSKAEAFRQARNLARAAQASIMVYEVDSPATDQTPRRVLESCEPQSNG